MPHDNPSRILRALDSRLEHPVELTLIGKAAIWLGYDQPPEDYGSTLDVDAVVPASASAALDQDIAFWDALAQTNDALSGHGLYLTHIFEESQVFLRPYWAGLRVRIMRPELERVSLFRPATLDLILTKMMRGADAAHMAEIQWLITQDGIRRAEMLRCLDEVRLPDDTAEWAELFAEAGEKVTAMTYPADSIGMT